MVDTSDSVCCIPTFPAELGGCADNIHKPRFFLASLCLRNITRAQKKTEHIMFTMSVASRHETLKFSCRHVPGIFYL